MTEPPPDVGAPEHRWIWDAACRLLEENASFTDRGDDIIVSDIREDAWHNSDVEQETLTVRRVGFNACPFLLRPLPSGGERLEWQANGFARLSAVSQAKRGAHGPVDVTKIEQIELDLTNLIERRHDRRVTEEGERTEELWAESVRKHAAKQRLQARYEWHMHHQDQAKRLRRTLESLIAHHEAEASKLGGDAA